eukprot:6203633-Pleurochrysis_carterae.AAC.4
MTGMDACAMESERDFSDPSPSRIRIFLGKHRMRRRPASSPPDSAAKYVRLPRRSRRHTKL